MNNIQVMDESLNSIRRIGEEGRYYWTSRELGCTLGYSSYQKFQVLLIKSINEAEIKGVNVSDHFNLQVELVEIGSNAKRSRENYYLSKEACLIILDNADRRKDVVKGAINYFLKRTDIANDGECDLHSQLVLTENEKELVRERNKRYWEDLNRKASSKFIKKTECLMKVGGLKRDDSFHENYAPHHIMYKLGMLKSEDGNRAYEFLIEYDVYEPTVGIYYGCKGLIFGGDQDEQIAKFIEEWEGIKEEICIVLNNTFPGKDFAHRFKPTNNANNNTYWPFWITLYDEENIVQVAVRSIQLIMKIYEGKLRLEKCENYSNEGTTQDILERSINEKCKNPLENENEIEFPFGMTAFTDEAHQELLNILGAENLEYFQRFINSQIDRRNIADNRSTVYEYAHVVLCDGVDFVYSIVSFFNYLRNEIKTYKRRGVPWQAISRIFLNKNEKPFGMDTLKNSKSKYGPTHRKYTAQAREEINRLFMS